MLRKAFSKAVENLTGRKALMTIISFEMVFAVSLIAGRFPAIQANLPTILGSIVAILTVFLTGHAVDSKWSPAPPPDVTKKELPAAAKAAVAAAVKTEAKIEEKVEEKKAEEEEGS
jgi:hypothetical protein